jgi:hypothetical protein
MVTATGVGITSDDLENYLRQVGALNARAATFGAIGVMLSTATSIAAMAIA